MKKRVLAVVVALLMALSVCAVADSGFIPGDFLGAEVIFWNAVVVAKSVTLRTLPSYDGQRVTSIPGGAMVDVVSTADNGRWLQVTYNAAGRAQSGWVLAEYVVQNPMTLILRADNVPAYAAPSTRSAKVGSLPCYTTLSVIGEWDDYYVVSLRNAAAYIRKDARYWTDWDLAEYEQGQGHGYTVTTRVKTTTRTGPGTGWASVEQLAAGTTLETLSKYSENGWYVVRYQDTYLAYVNAADVDIVSGWNDDDDAVG